VSTISNHVIYCLFSASLNAFLSAVVFIVSRHSLSPILKFNLLSHSLSAIFLAILPLPFFLFDSPFLLLFRNYLFLSYSLSLYSLCLFSLSFPSLASPSPSRQDTCFSHSHIDLSRSEVFTSLLSFRILCVLFQQFSSFPSGSIFVSLASLIISVTVSYFPFLSLFPSSPISVSLLRTVLQALFLLSLLLYNCAAENVT